MSKMALRRSVGQGNELVVMLLLSKSVTVHVYNFHTGLIVVFCLVVNALCARNVTKTNSCVHLNVTGE